MQWPKDSPKRLMPKFVPVEEAQAACTEKALPGSTKATPAVLPAALPARPTQAAAPAAEAPKVPDGQCVVVFCTSGRLLFLNIMHLQAAVCLTEFAAWLSPILLHRCFGCAAAYWRRSGAADRATKRIAEGESRSGKQAFSLHIFCVRC